MDIIMFIAERKIREAMENGQFDHLPGRGQAIDLNEDANLSDEMRLYLKIMRNMQVNTQDAGLLKQVSELRRRLKKGEFASKEEENEARAFLGDRIRHLSQKLKK